ncbi:MAG TPA: DNA polymerase III subunit delta' [Stenomitos sp.]
MASSAFASLIGQSQAIELLTRAIECDRIAPAYLFFGPEGVGRKLAAKAFLEALLLASNSSSCHRHQENHPDILWVAPTYLHQGKAVSAAELTQKGIALPKARPQVRLDQVRDITRFLSQTPLESPRLLVVIEEAQTMGESAANGLLKTLEEPGEGTLILIAPSIDALLPTIVSRCQRIPFRGLSNHDLRQVLQHLGQDSLLNHAPLLQMAQGSPGLALQYWEKLQSIPSGLINACHSVPQTPLACLELARQVEKNLDIETQLWLLNYLQQHYWTMGHSAGIKLFEQAKTYLTNYVQPQLVWEVTLLNLNATPT